VNSVRDEGAAQTAPVDPANDAPGAAFQGSGPEMSAQSIRATLVSLTTPLGAGTLAVSTGLSSNATAITRSLPDAGAFSPYDVSLVDKLTTVKAEWTHEVGASMFAAGALSRAESLSSPDQFEPTLQEHATQTWLRASTDLGPRVRLGASVVSSHWSTFGNSADGRIGVAVDDGANGTLRFSVGTGYRTPLLSELYTLPLAALTPDANCVGANGNQNERAEHATEYELGYGKRFGATTADATVYRTNLRDPVENFYPFGAACGADKTQVVAQSFATAEYGVNSAYPTAVPDFLSNPTSGSNIVLGQQFAGLPLQAFTFGLRYARAGLHGAANLTAKSANNELAQGPFAKLDAALGKTWGHVDLTLAGHNLTNAVSGRFTRLGMGTLYSTASGPVARDALVLEPASVRLILTLR
jgi:hypothetical protein